MHSFSFINDQPGNGFAKVISTHNASALVQALQNSNLLVSYVDKMHSILSADPPFMPRAAQNFLTSHGKGLDIALLTHKDQVLTLATNGSGVIFLKRSGKIVEIVGDGKVAQGPPERGDEYILTTMEFLDLIGGIEGLEYYFLHYSSAEIVEMMKTFEDQAVACGFIAIQYGSLSSNPSMTLTSDHMQSQNEAGDDSHALSSESETASLIEESESPLLQTNANSLQTQQSALAKIIQRAHQKIVSIRIPSPLNFLRMTTHKQVKLALVLLIPAIAIAFFISRNNFQKTPQTSNDANYLQTIQNKIEEKLRDADTEAFVNISGIEATFAAARQILNDMPEKQRKKYAAEISALTAQIDAKEKEVMRISDIQAVEYFDLRLISADASASDVDFNDGKFYILDGTLGKIYIVESAERSHEVVASDKYKGATQITATGKYIYVLTATEGIYLAEQERSTQVVKPDNAWGTVSDMKAYTGNLYVLDSEKNTIIKYPGVDEQTFGDIAQYLVAELQENLKDDTMFSIDGSIYTASDGSITKLTLGSKADFNLVVPHKQMSVTAIYTDSDLEQLYVFDSKYKALYAMNKDGVFDKQWIVNQPVIALAAIESGSKIFAVTPQYIYVIDNKSQ